MRSTHLFAGAVLVLAATAAGQQSPDSPAYWLSHAQADAAQLADPAEKAGALTTIAFEWSSNGDTASAAGAASAANAAAAQIPDPQSRFRAYLGLAGFADQWQDATATQAAIAAAQAAANALPEGPQRQAATGQLANLHTVVDGFPAVMSQLSSDPDPVRRRKTYANLASNFAQAGPRHHSDYTAAIAAASADLRLVKDPNSLGMIQSLIGQAQVRAGELDLAAATAKGIVPPSNEADVWTALAEAYAAAGQKPQAADAIAHMITDAGGVPDDRRASIYLNVARARQSLGDSPGALAAVDLAVNSANRLEPADRADALSSAAVLRCNLGDQTGAAVLAGDAAQAAGSVTDPTDAAEVNMTMASAQARCGLGQLAGQSVATAIRVSPNIPPQNHHPDGDPPPSAFLEVVQAAAMAGDFATAQSIAESANNPRVQHDTVLAIAQAEVNLAQYQAAEDAVRKEGSVDTEAAVCGMISASLARTRTPADAQRWISRLNNPSDKVAAQLAVAQAEPGKPAAGH